MKRHYIIAQFINRYDSCGMFQVSEDEHGQLVVARVLAGGAVAQQGLLGPGDVVLEVNGSLVSSPEQLKAECARAGDHITLKVGPNNHIHPMPNQINKLTVTIII